MRTWLLLTLTACTACVSAAEPVWDVLMLRDGRTQSCRVLAVTRDGRVQFVKPRGGGRIVLPATKLRGVRIPGADVEAAATHTIMLRNGDRLACQILQLNAQGVKLRAPILGARTGERTLKLRDVTAIRRIVPQQAGVVETDFAVGDMAPWSGEPGHWMPGAGGVYAVADPKRRQNMRAMIVPLKQEGGVEIELRLDAADAARLMLRLTVSVQTAKATTTNSGLLALFHETGWSVSGIAYLGGRPQSLGTFARSAYVRGKTPPKLPRRATFRLTYDPETGAVAVWIDGKKVGEGVCPQDMRQHKPTHVRLECGEGALVQYVRAGPLRKLPPPQPEPQKERDVIQLASGDLLSCTSIELDGDVFAVESDDGEFEFPMNRVDLILPRTAGRPAGRAVRGVVYVRTARSALTLQLRGMNGNLLLGRSAVLGEVRVGRKGMKALLFQGRPSTAGGR
jgi:hypothetical protein